MNRNDVLSTIIQGTKVITKAWFLEIFLKFRHYAYNERKFLITRSVAPFESRACASTSLSSRRLIKSTRPSFVTGSNWYFLFTLIVNKMLNKEYSRIRTLTEKPSGARFGPYCPIILHPRFLISINLLHACSLLLWLYEEPSYLHDLASLSD